jgi:hypothetical protein
MLSPQPKLDGITRAERTHWGGSKLVPPRTTVFNTVGGKTYTGTVQRQVHPISGHRLAVRIAGFELKKIYYR